MAKDFIPMKDGVLLNWLISLKKLIIERGAHFGLSPQEVSDGVQLCDEYIYGIRAAMEARLQAKSAVAKKKDMRKTHQPMLRHIINRIKISPGRSVAESMHMFTHKQHLDAATYKPLLKLVVTGDHIEVRFKKRGIDGMKLKVKIGEDPTKGEWKELEIRQRSPFHYKPEGYAQGTVLRVWFIGIAIVKDEHFGNWSDMASVLYVAE